MPWGGGAHPGPYLSVCIGCDGCGGVPCPLSSYLYALRVHTQPFFHHTFAFVQFMVLNCLDSLLHAHQSLPACSQDDYRICTAFVSIFLSSSTMPIIFKSGITGEVLVDQQLFVSAMLMLLDSLPPETIFKMIPDSPNSALIVIQPGPATICYLDDNLRRWPRTRPEIEPLPGIGPGPHLQRFPMQCALCLSIGNSRGYLHNQWQRRATCPLRAQAAGTSVLREGPLRRRCALFSLRRHMNSCLGQRQFETDDLDKPLLLDYSVDAGHVYICHACTPESDLRYAWSCFKCKKAYFQPPGDDAYDWQMMPTGTRPWPTLGEPVDFVWCAECVDAVVEISSDSD